MNMQKKVSHMAAAISAIAFAVLVAPSAVAQDEDAPSALVVAFEIRKFQVDGNTLLPQARIDELVAPFTGPKKVYGDIQQALEALGNEYRRLGYGTVNVLVPEQELTSGVVRLQVTEGKIGKVSITGNQYFDEENIRASLPDLKEGAAPNLRKLSENTQLSNENPAKQVDVTLGVSEEEGKINARVDVAEDNPQRFYVTLDNTGTHSSGKDRIGVAYQHANLFNRDQILTLAYTTAIDAPGGVEVDIYSIGYRLPLYNLGDSIDFIYGNSSTNLPSVTPNLTSPLAINGKGSVIALRYNHMLGRQGLYTSKLVAGYDYKYFNNTCNIGGAPTPYGVAGCTPYTLQPVSLTYSGQWQKPGQAYDYYAGAAYNLNPIGAEYPFPGGPGSASDHYSAANGRSIKDKFTVWRFGGNYLQAISGDWLGRVGITAQYTQDALPSPEQLGLAGVNAVRGFSERAMATDRGYVTNLEITTPDFASHVGAKGSLRGIFFYDFASGHNVDATVDSNGHANIAALGTGLRYSLKKDISARFDVAVVTDGGWQDTAEKGDFLGYFSMTFGF
jgi:hemolysin activation/secretion protein